MSRSRGNQPKKKRVGAFIVEVFSHDGVISYATMTCTECGHSISRDHASLIWLIIHCFFHHRKLRV